MGKLFNRPADSQVDTALREYAAAHSGNLASVAVVHNFRCDHRVSEDRMGAWLGKHPIRQARDFPPAVQEYWDDAVKAAGRDTFLHGCNGDNAVYGGGQGHRIQRHVPGPAQARPRLPRA